MIRASATTCASSSAELGCYTFPPNTKLAGHTSTRFVADDGTLYMIANQAKIEPPIDTPVTVEARRVEPSPYIARIGGPHLWVLSFTAR